MQSPFQHTQYRLAGIGLSYWDTRVSFGGPVGMGPPFSPWELFGHNGAFMCACAARLAPACPQAAVMVPDLAAHRACSIVSSCYSPFYVCRQHRACMVAANRLSAQSACSRSAPRRSALLASTELAMVRVCVSRSRKSKSASTPSTSAPSAARCVSLELGEPQAVTSSSIWATPMRGGAEQSDSRDAGRGFWALERGGDGAASS
jgi:hypothetical protein